MSSDRPKSLPLQLDPAMPAEAALRSILRQQLEALEANRDGARSGRESEDLHDFRVAIRRSRTVLGQFKTVFPAPVRRHFRGEFAWLGEITGPTRDLDVYLLDFPGQQSALPEAQRDDLLPLHQFLRRHRQMERQRLARRLDGKRYHRLVTRWRHWLEGPAPDPAGGADAGQPVSQLAGRQIGNRFQQVIEAGSALAADSPDAAFHDLRKRCKKLRYLLEFFASLYPDQPLRQLVKSLKALQDLLGSFQDLSVQVAALRDFSRQMSREREIPPATLLAMGMLIEQLHKRQLRQRGAFHRRFAAFAGDANRRLFTELFAAHLPQPDPQPQ